MNSLLMSQLIPDEILHPLRVLGKHNWVRWSPSGDDPPSTQVEYQIPDEEEPRMAFLRILPVVHGMDALGLLNLFGLSKMAADGPKVLRPSVEQCEALEHVDASLSFEDFEQPFPAFLLEVPNEYRRQLTDRFGHPCPRIVMNFHDQRTRYIVSSCFGGANNVNTMTVLSPRPQWQTIEDALELCLEEDGPDIQQGTVLYRLAINFGLLLTRFGAKDCGPVDPIAHIKQQQLARRSKGRKAERARRLLDATINLIAIEQNVVFVDKPHESARPNGEGGGRKPHWRRGHFRRQSCGPKRCERRLIFVRPCFIRSDSFAGDKADTSYSISLPRSTPSRTEPSETAG